MIEKLNFKGTYQITYWGLLGNFIKREEYNNVICQSFYNNLSKQMTGGSGSLYAETLKTGDGSSLANRNNTNLENVLFTKNITIRSYTSTSIVLRTVLAPADSNFLIKEIGIFNDVNEIISRVNTNIDKNASTQIEIIYTIQF
jgi:hypothetical protein